MQRAADEGVISAYHNLGILYSQGLGVPRNRAMAAKYWLQAIENKCESSYAYAEYVVEFLLDKNDYSSALRLLTCMMREGASLEKRVYDRLMIIGYCLLLTSAADAIPHVITDDFLQALQVSSMLQSESDRPLVIIHVLEVEKSNNVYALDAYAALVFKYYLGCNIPLLHESPQLELKFNMKLMNLTKSQIRQLCEELKSCCSRFNTPRSEEYSRIGV